MAWILFAFGALVALGNVCTIVWSYVARKHVSMVPFVGGLVAFAGCALLPALGWKLGLLALALDPGCLLLAVAVPVDGFLRRRRA